MGGARDEGGFDSHAAHPLMTYCGDFMRRMSFPTRFFASAAGAAGLMCILSVPQAFAADETLVDRIAAVVDGAPILHSVVTDKVEHGPLVVVSDFPSDEQSPAYQRALNDLINFELINKKVREYEIDIKPEELDAEINQYLSGRGLTREQLDEYLTREGKTYDEYKLTFRDSMLVSRFQGRVINPFVKITDKDVENFYVRKSGSSTDMIEITLRQILISIPTDANPDIVSAKQALAREIQQKVAGGASFAEMARIYSDDSSSKDNGGLLPKITLKDLAQSLRTHVESLEIGKSTAPIRLDNGFALFYVDDKRFASSAEFESKKRELEYELRSIEIQNQTRRWLSEQRQKSKVEIIP